MISKLRRKFVLINMMFVMAVMVTVMIILYASTYKNDQNSIDRSLEMSLSDNKKDLRPSIGQNTSLSGAADGANANTDGGTGDTGGTGTDFHGSPEGLDAGSLSAVFTVEADEDGNIVSIDDTMVQIDTSTVAEAVQSVLSSEKDKGHIFSLALAYKTKTISSGTKIAFLDISSINSSLRKLIVNELLIFLGSMLVFLRSASIFHVSS